MVKLKSNQIPGFVRNPGPDAAVILVYGPDYGGVVETVGSILAALLTDPEDAFSRANLSASEVKQSPERLLDEAWAQSLLGTARAVRVSDADDTIAPAVKEILDRITSEIPPTRIILAGTDLGPRAKLRKLCEDHPNAVAVPCYVDDGDATRQLIRQGLADAHIKLDGGGLDLATDLLEGGRAIARQGIEKLVCYAGESRVLTEEDVLASLGDPTGHALNDIVLACFDGDLPAFDRAYDRFIHAGESPIALIRAALSHLARILPACIAHQNGQPVAQALSKIKPPVFFKLKSRFNRQVGTWKPGDLMRVAQDLMATENALKQSHAAVEILCATAMSRVARRALSLQRR